MALSLVAAVLAGVGCSGGAKSTPPSSLDQPLPKAATPEGGGRAKTPPPPSSKVDWTRRPRGTGRAAAPWSLEEERKS